MEKIIKSKKFALGLGVLSAATVPIATAISCGEEKEKEYTINSKYDVEFKYSGQKVNKKIGYLLSDPENPRWQKSKKYMDIYGKKVFTSVVGNIIKSASEQLNYVKSKASEVDGFIVAGEDATIQGAFDSFSQTKPIISFDRMVKTSKRNAYNWYVTFDNLLVGRMQGLSILNKLYNQKWTFKTTNQAITNHISNNPLNEEKIILAIAGSSEDTNAPRFHKGAVEKLKLAADADSNFVFGATYQNFAKVAVAGWKYSVGQTKLRQWINTLIDQGDGEKIAAILSPNDGLAIAAVNALELEGLDPKKVYITGQDANDVGILSIAGKKNVGQDMTISKPDTRGTAVAMSLMKVLLSNPSAYNVAPASLTASNKAAILKIVRADFPGINFEYDSTEYVPVQNKAALNTLILRPEIITNEKIGTTADKIFQITET